jgi:hypothetical protein
MLAVLGLLSGGCVSVTFGEREEKPPTKSAKVIEAMRARSVSFDLRTPPSREEGGLLEGQDTAFYSDRKGFDLQVLLPEDHVLRLRVDTVFVNAPVGTYGRPSAEPPQELLIKSRGEVRAARDLLLGVAREYGLPAAEIENWAAYSRPGAVPSSAIRTDTGYIRATLGYLTVEVRGVYRLEANEAVASISLHWRLPATPTSPTPLSE